MSALTAALALQNPAQAHEDPLPSWNDAADLLGTYLPQYWGSLQLELDIPRPRGTAAVFEDVFACPVALDAAAVTVRFNARPLDRPSAPRPNLQLVTLADLARARFQPASLDDFRGIVHAQIWAQGLSGQMSIGKGAWHQRAIAAA